MNVFIARQPVFDKSLNLYGYELLHRQSTNNCFEQMDDDKATLELINNVFSVVGLQDLTGGTKAFINFSKNIIESEIPYMLPCDETIIEIVQRGEISLETIIACKKLRSKGYLIAIDDFSFSEDCSILIEEADIIKIDFSCISLDQQRHFIKQYGNKTKILAKKIESREDFNNAVELGYNLFQGYFFSKPLLIAEKEIDFANINLLKVIEELNKKDADYKKIVEIIKQDLGLSYKLLKIANTVYFGTQNEVKSILEVILRLGEKEIYQWITLMIFKNIQTVENAETIKLSLIRGKFMELLAYEINKESDNSEYFFTGSFSLIDVILNKDMKKILEGIPLSIKVKDALLRHDNELRRVLDCVINYEMANWEKVYSICSIAKIDADKFISLYVKSINWAKQLNF